MKKIMEKNRLFLIIFILIIVGIFVTILILLHSKKQIEIIEVNENNYCFKYDSSWKIETKNENDLKLINKENNSTFEFIIMKLEGDMQYKDINELCDILVYNLQKENSDYKMIRMEECNLTKNSFLGKKVLFENGDDQVMVYFYRQGDKSVVFSYEASYKYFDILLDSVNSIIDSFNLKNESIDIESKLELDLKNLNFSEEKEISDLLNGEKDISVDYDGSLLTQSSGGEKKFVVQCIIPDNFRNINDYEYTFNGLSGGKKLDLNIKVVENNIYEYLDKNSKTGSVFSQYSSFVDSEYFTDFEEGIEQLDSERLGYIYKNNYKSKNYLDDTDNIYENIVIIYEIDNNHIITLTLSSDIVGIPEDVIDMIKIKNIIWQ